MTYHGLCVNLSYSETRLTEDQAAYLLPDFVRSIVYSWPGSYETCIDQAKGLSRLGISTYIAFNNESYPGDIGDNYIATNWLASFLDQAEGAIAVINAGNELDNPAWNIPIETIVEYGKRIAEVCHRYNVRCSASSIIRGPEEGGFEQLVRGLEGHVDYFDLHPYYCSIGGIPSRPELHQAGEPGKWRFGTIEDKVRYCQQFTSTPILITEAGFPVGFDGITKLEQSVATALLRRLEMPGLYAVAQFCLGDAMVPTAELEEGKHWGLLDEHGVPRLSYYNIRDVIKYGEYRPGQAQYRFAEGFLKLHALNPALFGDPLEDEYGPFGGCSTQLTTTGTMFWAVFAERGPTLLFKHYTGRLFSWRETDPSYQEHWR